MFLSSPDGDVLSFFFLGVKRTRQGKSGFLCPDGELSPVFPRFLSFSWRADPGILVNGKSKTPV
jgi:hypothetical protein